MQNKYNFVRRLKKRVPEVPLEDDVDRMLWAYEHLRDVEILISVRLCGPYFLNAPTAENLLESQYINFPMGLRSKSSSKSCFPKMSSHVCEKTMERQAMVTPPIATAL